MKKIIILLHIFSCSLFFTGCENWFDVQPKSQVKNDDLFENESGYKTALFGIYTTMATTSLYGQQLSMSFLDVLAQYYTLGSSYHSYYYNSIYDYNASTVKSQISSIWKTMYKTIMNCNNLLENMEGQQAKFGYKNYDLIRGEVLGIRAWLHFDLLRMYAPSFAVGENEAAIPYVDKVVRTPFDQLTNKQVVERILEDCEAALKALEVSDPYGPAGETVGYDDDFLDNRMERMNYYAVKALMARVYLWAGRTSDARTIAQELIRSKKFGVNSPIFWLYSDKLTTYSTAYYSESSEGSMQLPLSQSQRKEFYETDKYASQDRRISSWLVLNSKTMEDEQANTGRYLVTKYSSSGPMYQDIPLIRMTEMYYILAECETSEAEALKYLNTVRQDYGIPEAMNLQEGECVVDDELFKEYRKSFIAEGQLFYYLKRKDVASIPGAVFVENPRTVFTLPLPEDEQEFGNLIN